MREENNFQLLVNSLSQNNILAKEISELSMRILTESSFTNIKYITPPIINAKHRVSQLYGGTEKTPRHIRQESFEELHGKNLIRGVEIMEPIPIIINNEHEFSINIHITCVGNSVTSTMLEV